MGWKSGRTIFYKRAAEEGITIKGSVIEMDTFIKLGLPMIVECSCCGATTNLFNAVVSEELDVYCSGCVGDAEIEDIDKWTKYQVKGYKLIEKVPPRRNITTRQLDIKYGNEGPEHDLYAYTEYIVRQNGIKITLHTGLVDWVKIDDTTTVPGEEAHIIFNFLTGFESSTFMRWYEKIRSKCPYCDGSSFEWVRGFPGEHLKLCKSCKRVVNVDFNKSLVL